MPRSGEVVAATFLVAGTLILFYVDITMPRGVVDGVGYPVLVAFSSRFGRRALLAFAAFTTILIIAAALLVPDEGVSVLAELANRGFALASNWIIALLLLERLRVERRVREAQLLTRGRQAAYIDLMREVLLSQEDFETRVRRIAEIAATAMEVEFVGIYRNLEGRPIIRCLDIWQRSTASHSRQPDFPENSNPELAKILNDQFVIATDDIAAEPLLQERRKVLEDLGVRATMAAGIFVDGKLAGQISFGNAGAARRWTTEDKIVARALAVLLALLYANSRHERALAAFDFMSEGVIVEDESGYPVYANAAARALASAAGNPGDYVKLSPMGPEDHDRHQIRHEERDLLIERARLPDGGVISRVNDVTARNAARRERDALQARLQQAAKMEAIGQLAGGVAHDFNNILGSIMGFATFLLQDLVPNTPQHGFAQKVLSASQRGKELIDQILAFARARTVERTPVRLQSVIAQATDLLAPIMPAKLRFDVNVKPDGLVVQGNPVQLCQLISNLCINARDAAGDRGHVTLEIARAGEGELADATLPLSAQEASIGELDPARRYAMIRVTDDGRGIPESVLPHIFEPFYTTKGRMRGTGLGLAVVHGVVQSHQGFCRVTSRPGAGTVFCVLLPVMADAVGLGDGQVLGSPQATGSERVLIVDDESDLVDMLSIGLARLGYESVGVNDPVEALAAFEEDPAAWDVVVSDQLMPDMKGADLVRRLKTIRPEIRTILCSGYSEGLDESAIRAADVYVSKPVDALEIARRIRILVDGSATDGSG